MLFRSDQVNLATEFILLKEEPDSRGPELQIACLIKERIARLEEQVSELYRIMSCSRQEQLPPPAPLTNRPGYRNTEPRPRWTGGARGSFSIRTQLHRHVQVGPEPTSKPSRSIPFPDTARTAPLFPGFSCHRLISVLLPCRMGCSTVV